jgi:hypothetical protein
MRLVASIAGIHNNLGGVKVSTELKILIVQVVNDF